MAKLLDCYETNFINENNERSIAVAYLMLTVVQSRPGDPPPPTPSQHAHEDGQEGAPAVPPLREAGHQPGAPRAHQARDRSAHRLLRDGPVSPVRGELCRQHGPCQPVQV